MTRCWGRLGIFALKYPSLLQFDELVRQDKESVERQNFLNLFGVVNPPDDTNMRQALDEVEPAQIRPLFKEMHNHLKDNKYLDSFYFYKKSFLLAMDGTGFFSSHDVHCDNCCVKKHRDDRTTHHHQAVVVAMVHPNNKEVVPLDLEPIVKQDGTVKNDCDAMPLNGCLLGYEKPILVQQRTLYRRTIPTYARLKATI